jgi:two-component system, response regulator YesN
VTTLLRILVVDDEAIERNGLKRLISKYQLELEVYEAENGEEALELLRAHAMDILITDIKMPFMDGMELSKRAREQFPELRIIIFSAYGEFEYAQKAIRFQIFSYLLKPIDVHEFVQVFTSVIDACKQERLEKERQLALLEGYQRGMEYEKEKLLLDLIHTGISEPGYDPLDMQEGRFVQLVLIDFGERFFDRETHIFPELLYSAIASKLEYVNLNESQSLLFILHDHAVEQEETYRLGERLLKEITSFCDETVTLVVSGAVSTTAQLKEQYHLMETLLEHKFFYKESMVLYTDANSSMRPLEQDSTAKLLESIHWHLSVKDYFGFQKGVELFFSTVDGSGQNSAIYMKYLCIELTKKMLEATGKELQIDFQRYVEQIFGSKSLEELKSHVLAAMKLLQTDAQLSSSMEDTKKVIKDIVQLVEKHYMEDISLKWIADKVYLTQTYVSYLFSKEMGQTLVKYITWVRMRKAAELLKETNMTIVHISEKVGYVNDSYFGKIFKTHYGVSPAKYREMSG